MNWNAAVSGLFTGQGSGYGPALVMFDLDGTLINSVPDLAAAIDQMLQHFGQSPAGERAVSHWVGNGADKLVRRAITGGDESAAEALSGEQVAPWRAVFDQAYLKVLHQATGVYPGVSELLSQLTCARALITNKPRLFTLPLLESLGWQDQFSCIVCGDDLAEKKPSPVPLQYVCEQLGYEPQQALMIGDSKHDIGAAKAAGIASVAVSYGYNHGEPIADSQPDWLVDNLMQLLQDIPA